MKRITALLLLCAALLLGPSVVDGYSANGGLHAQKKEKSDSKGDKKGKKGGGKPVAMDPKTKERVDYLFIEANTLYLQEKKTEAVGLFKELLTIDPKNHAAHYNIGKIQNELKNFGEGSKFCKTALDLSPDNFWYYTELVAAYEGAREIDKALSVQEALSKRFPEEKNALYDLGQLYILNKNFDKAIETYNKLEKLTGSNDEIMFRKHQLYVYTNQPDKAMVEIEKLIASNPTETRFWQAKYDLLLLQNKGTEARGVLEQILVRNPNDAFALLSMADYYKSTGQIQKSDDYLQRAFDNPEVDLDTKVKILSELYDKAQKDPSSMPRLERMSVSLLNLYPKSALVLGIRGDVFQASEKPDSARSYYRKSLAIDPTNQDVWSELVIIDSEQQDYKNLQKDAEKALEYYPNDVLLLYYYGTSATQNGDYEEAIYAFDKVRKTERRDQEILLQANLSLGECYHKTEQFAKSDECFDAAMKMSPNNPLVLNNYAYFLSLREERLDEATNMVKQALHADPDNGAYEDTYGWILYLQGNYKEAEQWIQKSVQHGGGMEVLEHYGDTWAKLGDMNKAKEYWQQAIGKGATFTVDTKVRDAGK